MVTTGQASLDWTGPAGEATVQRTTLDDVSRRDRRGVKTRVILSAVSAEELAEVSGKAAAPGRASQSRGLAEVVAADIHATSARRFHPSAAQPIAAAVSRELAIYDVKTRPSLATKANHIANFINPDMKSVNKGNWHARKFIWILASSNIQETITVFHLCM